MTGLSFYIMKNSASSLQAPFWYQTPFIRIGGFSAVAHVKLKPNYMDKTYRSFAIWRKKVTFVWFISLIRTRFWRRQLFFVIAVYASTMGFFSVYVHWCRPLVIARNMNELSPSPFLISFFFHLYYYRKESMYSVIRYQIYLLHILYSAEKKVGGCVIVFWG